MNGTGGVPRTMDELLRNMRTDIAKLKRRQYLSGVPDRLSAMGEVFTDCNKVLANGFYRGSSPINGPTSTALASLAVYVGGNGKYIRQEFRRLFADATTQDLRVWARTSSNGGASWTSWVLATAPEQVGGIVRGQFSTVFASATTAKTNFLTVSIPALPRTAIWVININGMMGFNAAAAYYQLYVATSAGTLTVSRVDGLSGIQAPASKWGIVAQVCQLELAPGTAATLTLAGQSSIATGDNYAMVDVVATPHWKGTN